MCSITVSFALDFDLVSLGLQCFLRLSSAGLIVVLIPGCYTEKAPNAWVLLGLLCFRQERKLQTPGTAEEHKR